MIEILAAHGFYLQKTHADYYNVEFMGCLIGNINSRSKTCKLAYFIGQIQEKNTTTESERSIVSAGNDFLEACSKEGFIRV